MVLLKYMTSPEVDAMDRANTVVLFPMASCEQHSLHLPVFVDSMICEEVAQRVSARVPNDVLVLPTQFLGYSQHHIKFPGTLSAVSETHLRLMEDTIASMADNGFMKFLILNAHGGNGQGISVLTQRLMERYGDTGREFYSRFAWGGDLDSVREKGAAGSGHAGETETSMILALFPDTVKMELAHPDGERDGMGVTGAAAYHRFDQRTLHGGVGDPTVGTAAKGEQMLEMSAEDVAATVLSIKAARPFESTAFPQKRQAQGGKGPGLWAKI
jgi:creatinine amidohydrolase